ncbi:MAG: extracellular solute-binding protein [Lachnospiraceae bacterium]|jgi:arabinogalactan oligomer/maltooligosaccharide transport system substrate-binding protein|nr:extracellular solute-binding protein [Lachnospiraceae bacterium]
MKKLIAIVLTLVMVLGLASGCKKADSGTATDTGSTDTESTETTTGGGETYDLKVWGAQEEQTLLAEMVEAFKAAHPENTYNIELGVVGEPDCFKTYSEDPEAAADVFWFANDQLRDFVNAGGLYEVTRNKDDIVSRNLPGSIEGATMNDKLYAYPATADNGYFLYYDKSVLSEEDVQSLDTILEKSNAAGKKVFMDVSNGWYIASFFLGNGGKLTLSADGKQECDFNNAAGVAVGEAIKKFTADPAFLTGDDDVLKGGIGGTISAGVSGTWNAEAVASALGDNYAAAKLPTFTVDGKQVQMASFGGYKLVGVNSLTKAPVAAMDLADFLTNEENQIKRFEARKIGPSNIKASESDAVKADVALAALAAQSAYALPQNDVIASYWTPAEAFGTAMETKDYSKDVQTLLNEMVAQIQEG